VSRRPKAPRPRLALAALLAALALATPDARALVWPDVPERVEQGLKSADPSARRAAAQELGTLGVARGTPLVLRALGDPDTEVRLAAAQSAIRLHAPGATFAVLPWLGDREARARIAACEVAHALPDPRAVPALARALGDPDATVRAGAADALGAQASTDAVAPLLGKLDDASPTVRVQIARALARLGDPRAVVPLVGKVQDSVSDVRQAVARALGELADPRASQALVLELRDNVDEVRIEALAALGRLRSEDAVDAIAPLALERKPALRQAAVAALGHIGSVPAVRALIALLGTGDDAGQGPQRTPVRDALVLCGTTAAPELVLLLQGTPSPQAATSAAWVLGELHAAVYAPTIVQAMRKGTLPVAVALHALGGAGTSDSVAVVLEFVDDPSPGIRTEALGASEALLDPARADGRAVEPLSAALRDGRLTGAERAKIATLLGRTGAPRAAPVLASLLGTHDPLLRLSAIDALGMLGSEGGAGDAADPLLEQLGDPDPAVRLHAAVSLGDAGSARAREALLGKLDSSEELDRPAVLTALGGILARLPTAVATARLERALDLAAGPERDALVVTLGRGATPASSVVLARLAHSADVDDRRTLATVLGSHGAEASAAALLGVMLGDADATVRAQAAWSLGIVGSPARVAELGKLVLAPEVEVAVDAAAALGRIGARAHQPDLASGPLCPHTRDARPLVRANVLAALALAGARCADGAIARRLLRDDVDVVRAAAARAVTRPQPSPLDLRALEQCAAGDRSGAVARRCRDELRPVVARPARTHAVEIYVVGDAASTPRPRDSYAIELADGLVHAGSADRRGAVFDPAAPEGALTLRRAPPLAPPPVSDPP
jgi:HEAT repeat protein